MTADAWFSERSEIVKILKYVRFIFWITLWYALFGSLGFILLCCDVSQENWRNHDVFSLISASLGHREYNVLSMLFCYLFHTSTNYRRCCYNVMDTYDAG